MGIFLKFYRFLFLYIFFLHFFIRLSSQLPIFIPSYIFLFLHLLIFIPFLIFFYLYICLSLYFLIFLFTYLSLHLYFYIFIFFSPFSSFLSLSFSVPFSLFHLLYFSFFRPRVVSAGGSIGKNLSKITILFVLE